jgi:hypothetical protein
MVGSDVTTEPAVIDKRKVERQANHHQVANVQSEELAQVTTQPDVQRAPVADTQPKQGELAPDAPSDNKVPVTVGGSEKGGAFVSPEIERQLESVNDQGKVVDDSQRSEAVRASWITARRSFFQP